MAERDELGGPLGAHDPRKDRGLENRPLGRRDLPVLKQPGEGRRKGDDRDRVGGPPGHGLPAHVHHLGAVAGIEV